MPRLAESRPLSVDAVIRVGIARSWHDGYHALIATTWPRFVGILVLGYTAINLFFAFLYALVPDAVANNHGGSVADDFFFSVQTLATIGYGVMYPQSFYGNMLVAIESTVGILMLPVVTGLVFAKFARPTARVVFSDRAIITT